jgi:hypothetical protein
MVPKHLRKFIKSGIFIIPNEILIEDYHAKKADYIEKIKNSKETSVNSLHKYTAVNPIAAEDIRKMNMMLREPLNKFYSQYLKHYEFGRKEPELFASFGISYDQGHKGLQLHIDDSVYTINLCLHSTARGNEVVFNEMVVVDPLEDFALVHSGRMPHHTNELMEGERTNVVLWFK